jgi:hypothetical protein
MDATTLGLTVVAAGEALWLAGAAGIAAAYHPRRPEPGPTTTELRDEPPAVVNLLTHGWDVTSEAVPATLLDLAARSLVEIVQVSPDNEVVQLRPRAETAKLVTPYEKQVLDHLRKVAVNGVVPARALTTGPQAASQTWWRRFDKAVVGDARRRGLSRSRYPTAVLTALGLFLPLFLVLIVLFLKSDGVGDETAGDPAWWAVGASFVGLLACFTSITRFNREAQRDTATGRQAAAHWLGVRDAYASSDYDELPPGAVILYDRHLAYAAAMSAARVAVARLPLGAEDDRHAWSTFGGNWHQVEVHYPRRRAGWGMSPQRAIVTGLLWMLVLWVPIYVTARWGADLYATIRDGLDGLLTPDDTSNPLDPSKLRWISIGLAGLAALGLTVCTVAGLRRGLLPFVRGVLDLFYRRRVRGVVVRRRDLAHTHDDRVVVEHYAAVDDGTSSRIDAWKLRPELILVVSQGDEVEVSVTRHLGYVAKIRDLSKAAPLPPPVTPKGLAPPAIPPPKPPKPPRTPRRPAQNAGINEP